MSLRVTSGADKLSRGACALALWLAATSTAFSETAITFDTHELRTIFTLSPLGAAPRDTTNAVDAVPAAVELGERLFFDPRLSGRGDLSCAACHDPANAWQDGRAVAVGAGIGSRNTPALWNVAFNRWFFWDGRADSLWSQALQPIENAIEMDGSRLQVVNLIAADVQLKTRYEAVFGAIPGGLGAGRLPPQGGPRSHSPEGQLNWWRLDPVAVQAANTMFANVGKALAAFVATLTTGAAPFDRFVDDLRAGRLDSSAISRDAQRGLKIFVGKGRCVLCHSGPNLTNGEFHDIRVPTDRMPRDSGRLDGAAALLADEFSAAGPYSDDPNGPRARQSAYLAANGAWLGHFKTPTLRNVALTAPYMHRGQLRTLREVVMHYSTLASAAPPADPTHAEFLLATPLSLSETEIDDLLDFLATLTSERASVVDDTTPTKAQ